MSDESPWEYVQRRRAEGAKNELVRQELLARGVDLSDVQLLLARESSQRATPEVRVPQGTSESAWSVLQRMRAEGFSQPQIEAELLRQGHEAADVAALFADDPMAAAPGRRPPDPTATSVDVVTIVFGLLLIGVGAAVLLSGRINVISFVLIVSGVTRIANGLRAQPGALPEATLAGSLKPLDDTDPRARCQRHRRYASIGTCPRCGTFCCARCVSKSGLRDDQPCLACQRMPALVDERLRQLRKRTAARLLVGPALLTFIFALDLDNLPSGRAWLGVAIIIGVGSVPWLAAAGLQAFTSTFWPTWLSIGIWTLTTLFLLLVVIEGGQRPSLHLLPWIFGLWPAVAARRAALRIVQPPEPLIPEEAPAQAR